MLKKVYKIRVELTEEQAQNFAKLLGGYRFIYNDFIDYIRRDIQAGDSVTTKEAFLEHFEITKKKEGKEWLLDFSPEIAETAIEEANETRSRFIKENEGLERGKVPYFKSKSDNEGLKFYTKYFKDQLSYSNGELDLYTVGKIPINDRGENIFEDYTYIELQKERDFLNRPTGFYKLEVVKEIK